MSCRQIVSVFFNFIKYCVIRRIRELINCVVILLFLNVIYVPRKKYVGTKLKVYKLILVYFIYIYIYFYILNKFVETFTYFIEVKQSVRFLKLVCITRNMILINFLNSNILNVQVGKSFFFLFIIIQHKFIYKIFVDLFLKLKLICQMSSEGKSLMSMCGSTCIFLKIFPSFFNGIKFLYLHIF